MGKGANAYQPRVFTSVQVQTSAQGTAIPIIYGQSKGAGNLLWAGDLTKTPINNGKGGKGGGGKKGGKQYDYKAAAIMGLCEGPIAGIGQVWANGQTTTLAKLGLTLFTGTASQAVWSYLSTKHPDQALAYAYTAYLAAEAYDLGESATLPNHEFEIIGKLVGTMPGTVDVNYADCIADLVGNQQYSLGPLDLDATSLAFYKTYCQAQGLFFSPALTDANTAIFDVINNWMNLSNSWAFWSGASTKFVPLGDVAITANGVTYTPDLTIQYDLTTDDFVCAVGDVPIEIDQADPADLPNHVKLEVLDRNNQYDAAPVEWQDPVFVSLYGNIDASVTQAHDICDLNVANIVKMLIGQRGAYIPNTYSFKLGYEFSLLEPGDLVTICDKQSGIPVPRTVRITSLDEDGTDTWQVAAEDFIQGVGSVSGTAENGANGFSFNVNVDPGNVNPPGIFEPSSDLTFGSPELWLTASGGPEFGGCVAMISFDSNEYDALPDIITAPAWQGTLTAPLPNHADPDAVDTLAIDLSVSAGVMPTVATHDDADNFRTLCLITPAFTTVCPGAGEVIAYGGVTQGATVNQFNLTYLRRKLYGTAAALHGTGSFFSRFDLTSTGLAGNSVIVYKLPPQYIGKTIYLKFLSFNRFGNAVQDISTVTEYTYTPTGQGYGLGGGGIPTPSAGSLSGTASTHSVALSWPARASTDNIKTYQIWGAPGTGTAFGSCAKLYDGNALNTTIVNLSANTAYTFYMVAVNAIAASAPTIAFNITTLAESGYRAVTASASPLLLLATDEWVDITNGTGAPLVVQMAAGVAAGHTVLITDAGNTAGANKFTVKDNALAVEIDQILTNGGWTRAGLTAAGPWRLMT